jgi:hypothetical protein
VKTTAAMRTTTTVRTATTASATALRTGRKCYQQTKQSAKGSTYKIFIFTFHDLFIIDLCLIDLHFYKRFNPY